MTILILLLILGLITYVVIRIAIASVAVAKGVHPDSVIKPKAINTNIALLNEIYQAAELYHLEVNNRARRVKVQEISGFKVTTPHEVGIARLLGEEWYSGMTNMLVTSLAKRSEKVAVLDPEELGIVDLPVSSFLIYVKPKDAHDLSPKGWTIIITPNNNALVVNILISPCDDDEINFIDHKIQQSLETIKSIESNIDFILEQKTELDYNSLLSFPKALFEIIDDGKKWSETYQRKQNLVLGSFIDFFKELENENFIGKRNPRLKSKDNWTENASFFVAANLVSQSDVLNRLYELNSKTAFFIEEDNKVTDGLLSALIICLSTSTNDTMLIKLYYARDVVGFETKNGISTDLFFVQTEFVPDHSSNKEGRVNQLTRRLLTLYTLEDSLDKYRSIIQ